MTRRNLALVAAAVAALLVAWYLLLWSPKGDDLADAKARRDLADEQVEALEATLAGLRAAKEDEPALKEAAESVDASVPADADLASFVLQVQQSADWNRIAFTNVVPSAAQASATGGPTEIPVTINAGGGYLRMLEFFDDLADMPRLMVVDGLSLSANPATDEVSAAITARLFTAAAPDEADTATPTTTTTPAAATSGGGEL